MSSALAVAQPQQAMAPVNVAGLMVFNREQVDLIKRTICLKATDDEANLFIQICQRLRLDPFIKQIHFVKRWNAIAGCEVAAHQVGIDGFRAVAQRTGEYLGRKDLLWCGKDGKWVDVWLSSEPPAAAKCSVLRRGHQEAMTAIANFDFYAQRKKDGNITDMWKRGAAHMLAKCAEALSLRSAFPDELGSVYAPEEMMQAEVVAATPAADVSTSSRASEPAKSAVQKTKDAMRAKKQTKDKGPTLESVMAGIDAAETLAELDRVAVLANDLDPKEKAKAREAFKTKKHALKRNADLVDQEPPHDENGEVKQDAFDYGPPPMSDEDQRSWAGDEEPEQ